MHHSGLTMGELLHSFHGNGRHFSYTRSNIMVSLKDIAVECGVSIATVSKALNNGSDISEATRERIMAKAKEMGYAPNALARALKTNRTHNIGVLYTDGASSGLTHNFFAAILDSFKNTVEEQGYDITFINSSNAGRAGLSYLEHCRYRSFDGVMIACIDFKEPAVQELLQSTIPLVTIDYPYPGKCSVSSDNTSGIRDLVRYAYSMGHTRIAYIHGADSRVTRERLKSFHDTLTELNITIPQEYILEAPYRDAVTTEQAATQLLSLPVPPTCILCPDDYACFGVIKLALQRGIKIGRDIGLAGYDGILSGFYAGLELTTVQQNTAEIGRLAGTHLIEQIERKLAPSDLTSLVPGKLYAGNTIPRL